MNDLLGPQVKHGVDEFLPELLGESPMEVVAFYQETLEMTEDVPDGWEEMDW